MCPVSQIGRLNASQESMVVVGPLSAATSRISRAAPARQHLPLADLTGRFVQSDRNAVHKQDPGPALLLRGSW